MRVMLLALLAACGDKDAPTDDSAAPTDDSEAPADDTGEEPAPSEAGDTIAEATPVDLDDGPLLAEDAIGTPGDRDVFAIEVDQGEFIALQTVAWGLTGQVVCDTVLRLYDAEGNLLATNDDMPYRFQETDSAIFFQAAASGPVYVEVLEWSDWAEDPDVPPAGGATYVYELYGYTIDSLDVFENDTPSEAAAIVDGGSIIYYSTGLDDYTTMFYGDFPTDDDVDIWPITFSDASEGAHYQWSIWPTVIGGARFRLSLYNPDWELVATTTSPEITPDYYIMYDVGLAHPIGEGTWYAVVENLSGEHGPGVFYAGLFRGYVADFAVEEEEPNEDIVEGSRLVFEDSASVEGLSYARGHGHVPDFDDLDTWTITASDVGSLAGRYVNVTMMAEAAGSTGAFTLQVLDDAGGVLAESDVHVDYGGADPTVRDLLLPGTASVNLRVLPDDLGEDPLANHYYFFVSVSDDPVYSD